MTPEGFGRAQAKREGDDFLVDFVLERQYREFALIQINAGGYTPARSEYLHAYCMGQDTINPPTPPFFRSLLAYIIMKIVRVLP